MTSGRTRYRGGGIDYTPRPLLVTCCLLRMPYLMVFREVSRPTLKRSHDTSPQPRQLETSGNISAPTPLISLEAAAPRRRAGPLGGELRIF
jgi:hypothetical protein